MTRSCRLSRIALLALVSAASLAACGEASEEEGCACLPHHDGSCAEELCPQVVGMGELGNFVVEDPDALTCAITALRDRSPGVIRWQRSSSDGAIGSEGYLLIHPDGSGVRRATGSQSIGSYVGDTELVELEPESTYADCLGRDDYNRFECMSRPLDVVVAVCELGSSSP